MTPEAELLLMNASRAQLVREIIRPALEAGEIVLCDRFCDSTVAYQAYGRGLDIKHVQRVISFAVGRTRPDLTLLLMVPVAISEISVVAPVRRSAIGWRKRTAVFLNGWKRDMKPLPPRNPGASAVWMPLFPLRLSPTRSGPPSRLI